MHVADLVALNPTRVGEVVLIISKLDTLDQPFGELLLGDWLAVEFSTISDKELCCSVMPEVTGASHVLIGCPMDTELM